jgi:hypothetical protein
MLCKEIRYWQEVTDIPYWLEQNSALACQHRLLYFVFCIRQNVGNRIYVVWKSWVQIEDNINEGLKETVIGDVGIFGFG